MNNPNGPSNKLAIINESNNDSVVRDINALDESTTGVSNSAFDEVRKLQDLSYASV